MFLVPPIMVEGQAEEGGSQADQQRNQQDDQDDHQAGRAPQRVGIRVDGLGTEGRSPIA